MFFLVWSFCSQECSNFREFASVFVIDYFWVEIIQSKSSCLLYENNFIHMQSTILIFTWVVASAPHLAKLCLTGLWYLQIGFTY